MLSQLKKEILIKFSSMENSMEPPKVAPALIVFEPYIVLALLSITTYLSPSTQLF